MEPEGPLSSSQEPFSGSYPKSHQSSPYHPSNIRLNIIHTHLRHPSGLFPSGFPNNILYAFFFFLFVLQALSISSSLTWSF
jgi:hypothetical protein